MSEDLRYSDRDILTSYLRKFRGREFDWGSVDCAQFAAGWARLWRGLDIPSIRYRSKEEGMEKLRSLGYDSHIDIARELLLEAPISQASVGDLAVVPIGDDVLVIGIVTGDSIAALSERGLVRIRLSRAAYVLKLSGS